MKENFIHVCFVIDESGSMYGSEEDVIGGVKSTIEKQKQVKDGSCAVSLFRFAYDVTEEFIGKDINEVPDFKYNPGGCTAMNDGIGTAIDSVGKWIDKMDEKDKPSKNIIVIMTDGMENSSREYSLSDVKDRIKEQTEKYNWEFVYLGADVTSSKDAKDLGIETVAYSSKANMNSYFSAVSSHIEGYRTASSSDDEVLCATAFNNVLDTMTDTYEKSIGKKIK